MLGTGAVNSGEGLPAAEEVKASQVTFKQEQLPSIDFEQKRRSAEIGSQVRNQTKSKSFDSGEAMSNINYLLKPKGIEVYSQSVGTSADNGTPKGGNVAALRVSKRLSDIAELRKDQH